MVNAVYRLIPILIAGLFLSRCNLEVGNPDAGEDALGRNAPLSRLQLGLKSYTPCESSQQNCTSLPFILPGEETILRFEMTEAKLFLQQATLAPHEAQSINARVDLLTGSSIVLEQEIEIDRITAASLVFGPAQPRSAASYSISGTLILEAGDVKTHLPLTITYKDPFGAQTAIVAADGTLYGLEFDAETWFDFSQSGVGIRQLVSHAEPATCKQKAVHSCAQPSTVLSQLVAKQIANSLRPRQESRKYSSNGQMEKNGRVK